MAVWISPMYTRTSFDLLWTRAGELELPAEQADPEDICVYAAKFSEWTTALCANVTQAPSIVGVNQSKVLLLDKYFEWRNAVPRSHRNRVGKLGHVCLFHMFERAYEHLKVIELALTPPLLFLPSPPPPPPPAPPPPEIAGIFIGELENP